MVNDMMNLSLVQTVGVAMVPMFFASLSIADTLVGAFRPRPPEMVVDNTNQQLSGPIKEIIEEAAEQLGHTIHWQVMPFQRTLMEAKWGRRVDLIPRHQMITERYEYLLPMLFGFQDKTVKFLVRKGDAKILTAYEDLQKYTIYIKRGTSYWPRFNQDKTLAKSLVRDDDQIVSMYRQGRIDVAAILDPEALEAEFKKAGFSDYEYAEYAYRQVLGRFYSIPKHSRLSHLHARFNCALYHMRRSGRIGAIYRKYQLEPPMQFFDHQDSLRQAEFCVVME